MQVGCLHWHKFGTFALKSDYGKAQGWIQTNANICFKNWKQESIGLKNKLWKTELNMKLNSRNRFKPKLTSFWLLLQQASLVLFLTVGFLVCILWFHVCLGRVKHVDMNYKVRNILDIKTFSWSQPGICIYSRISILTTLISIIMVGDESTIDQVILSR